MADYTQTTFFALKDGYASGNPLKIIRGSEFDAEYGAISTAIGTKIDTAGDGISIDGKEISIDLSGLTTATIALADELPFADTSDSNNTKKTTLASAVDAFATGGVTGVDHDAGVLRVDPSLATAGTLAAADEIVFADVDNADALRKAPVSELTALIESTNKGTKEVSNLLQLSIDGLSLLSSMDPDADFVAVYDDSASDHKKVYPKHFIESVIADSEIAETDDLFDTDYLVYSRGQELRLVRNYHDGKRSDSTLVDLDTITEDQGNHTLINDTGAGITVYLPTASTVPLGWQTDFQSYSTGDTIVIQPTGTDTGTNVHRTGTTSSGQATVAAGGRCHVIKTTTGGYHMTGDIS